MLLGEDGALRGRARRTRCSSTCRRSRPATARALAERLSAEGHAFVDAPVTGSSPKAEAGTLTIMCGGAADDVERARPLFEVMGEKIVHAGEAGQGQAVKVISQGVTAVNCATLAQAITVARQTGSTSTRCWTSWTGGSSDSTMRGAQGPGRWSTTTSRCCSSSSTCSRTSQLCLEEARGGGRPVPVRRARRRALRRGRRARARRAGLRRRARGRRGPHRRRPLSSPGASACHC